MRNQAKSVTSSAVFGKSYRPRELHDLPHRWFGGFMFYPLTGCAKEDRNIFSNPTQAGMLGRGGAGMEDRMPLSFLKRLQHVQLPVRVACPEEIRHVSVLLATGLIEAEITTLTSTAAYLSSSLATVTRITADGVAELAKMSHLPAPMKTSMQFTRGFRMM